MQIGHLIENFFIVIIAPWLIMRSGMMLSSLLDNRSMFSVPLCNVIATASGILLLVAIGLETAFISGDLFQQVWNINGPLHQPLFGEFLIATASPGIPSPSSGQFAGSLSAVNFGLALGMTSINMTIALVGWRGFGAIRGMAAHMVLSITFAVAWGLRLLAVIWVIHWLNFWAFAALLIVLELRRREKIGAQIVF